MMAKVLTTAAVKKYQPTHKRHEIRDGGARGLFLVIQPSGSKSWAMRFRRPDGTPGKLTLGVVDLAGKEMQGEPVLGAPLSLAGARVLASEVNRQRAMGCDVIADYAIAKHRRHAEVEEGAANSFPVLVPRFIAEHARPKTRRWRDTSRLLGLRYPKDGGEPEVIAGGLMQRWANRSVRDIDGGDIWALVDETRRLGAPGLERRSDGLTDAHARAMFTALSSLFGWLAKHRRVGANPCTGVYRPDAPKARDRVLTDAEIVAFWHACDDIGEPFGQLLKLLLLTGCRLNEVAGMRRSEVSEDGATWSLPGARTKNGRPHVVPFAPLARDILATVKPIAGDVGFVFTTTGTTPVKGWSKIKGRLDEAMQVPAWRLHDLRRTAATGMAEIGIAPHIVEACLNHVSGARASVAGIYNRALHGAEKRAALERWASHVHGLVEGRPRNVVSLSAERGSRIPAA
jgi:integrase